MSNPEHRTEVPEAIVTVRLPMPLRDALRSAAESHQRSMSGQVRWLIERSLSHGDDDGTPTQAAADIQRQAA